MSEPFEEQNIPAYSYWMLLATAGISFLATMAIGLLAGVVTAFPAQAPLWPSLRFLRPFHTLLTLYWLFAGTAAVIGLFAHENKSADRLAARGQCALYLLFLVGAGASLVAGKYSGREYISWPVLWSIPLLAAVLFTTASTLMRWKKIMKHSSDAGWLILVGMILLPAGLVEAHVYLLGDIALDPGRDLAIQWHALDTVIAAWCINLYAVGMLLLPVGAKSMRGSWLFLLATIGILLDFGHHHYVSPQPHWFKLISFGATMLAAFSFVRHLRSVRRKRAGSPDETGLLLRHVEGWTLFAVGTGILMAIPRINFYLHGTYAVVAHTMGSIIGVNSFLIFAAAFSFAPERVRLKPPVIRWTSWSLLVFCVTLVGLGVARGVLRIDHLWLEWITMIRPWYILIPLSAIPLILCLGVIGMELVRCCMSVTRALLPARLENKKSSPTPGVT